MGKAPSSCAHHRHFPQLHSCLQLEVSIYCRHQGSCGTQGSRHLHADLVLTSALRQLSLKCRFSSTDTWSLDKLDVLCGSTVRENTPLKGSNTGGHLSRGVQGSLQPCLLTCPRSVHQADVLTKHPEGQGRETAGSHAGLPCFPAAVRSVLHSNSSPLPCLS